MKAINRNRLRERVFLFFTMAVCAAVLTGCCFHRQSQFVVVPEAVFRTEGAITNRICFPLTADDRQRGTYFLAAGGKRKKKGGSPQPGAQREIRLARRLLG